jgi:hypothetical protein
MQDSFDKERNDIRYYSIIYAVDDLKMQWKECLLLMKKKVLGTAEN